MASGDAQRVWFLEMLEALEARWSASWSWDEMVGFCVEMTALRTSIRSARGIQSPRMRCHRCGAVSRSDIPGVSVRSALFALEKRGVVDTGKRERLDRDWRRYQRRNKLDAYGRPKQRTQHPGCTQ